MSVDIECLRKLKDKMTTEKANESKSHKLFTQCVVISDLENIDGRDLVFIISKEYPESYSVRNKSALFFLRIGKQQQMSYTYSQLIKLFPPA